jgi:hypothetical protein
MSDTRAAVLDRLLPPALGLPGAGGLGLSSAIPEAILAPIVDALPDDFESAAAGEQTATLTALEGRLPSAFAALLQAVYSAYYTDRRVRLAIEHATGFPARAPQPLGHSVLKPFDVRLVETQRGRPALWRSS